MEYSVKDLIKILLKKWYVIVIVVCAVSAASFFLSRSSYEQAKKDYAYYTSVMEQVEEGAGTAESTYQITPQAEDENFLRIYSDFLAAHDTAEVPSAEQLNFYLLDAVEPKLELTLLSPQLLQPAQQTMDLEQALGDSDDEPIVVKELVEITYQGSGSFTVTVTGLPEASAKTVLESYTAELAQTLSSPIIDYTAEQTAYSFAYSEPVLADSAELAKLIMQEPVSAPSMVRTVATAAIFSFALICIVILVITFMRDSAALNKKENKQ